MKIVVIINKKPLLKRDNYPTAILTFTCTLSLTDVNHPIKWLEEDSYVRSILAQHNNNKKEWEKILMNDENHCDKEKEE